MRRMSIQEHMTYESLKNLRENNPAWRLLASDNASFILSFFYKEFVLPNQRKLPEHILVSKLENYMELIPHIRENNKKAKDYLVEWSGDGFGWLRRFYPKNEEEVHYDLSSSTEKAIEWLISLKKDPFIGTESRLIIVFNLLEAIISGTQTDPELKLVELEKKKEEIEREIELVKEGNIRKLEPTQIKERFQQASRTSREILSDFRAVEQNFRELSREMREKIAKWDRSKGELIGDYFSEKNDIYQSDQGKSFNAFMKFIMSGDATTRFDKMMEELKKIEALSGIVEQSGMQDIVGDWGKGSEHVLDTLQTMSEQLRRYVDESYIDEEKRINQLIKNIERTALELRGELLKQNIQQLDEVKADIHLPMDRNLFSPPRKVELLDEDIDYGISKGLEDSLYSHIYVDKEKLIGNIQHELMHQNEIGLGEVIEKYPLKYGLTELISYFTLNQKVRVRTEDGQYEYIEYENSESERVCAKVPKTIYLSEEQKN